MPMKYISTGQSHSTDLRGIVTQCVAPDGTLYLPEYFPHIPAALFNNIEQMSIREIAYVVISSLLGTDVDHASLKKIVDDTFIYNIPFKPLGENSFVMEFNI